MPLFCLVTGRVNVKQEEIDDMLKEASGPINFTVFLTMFGEKLKGRFSLAWAWTLKSKFTALKTNGEIWRCWTSQTGRGDVSFRSFIVTQRVCLIAGADPEETVLNAFKVLDPEGKGMLKKE